MTSALNKLFATASTLPKFTPALGHRYFPPTIKTSAGSSDSQSVQQSTRDGTPSVAGVSQPEVPKTTAASLTQRSSQPEDVQTLYESFNQFTRFRGEYMDENPLVGEPGAFVFSSSKQHLQSQQQQAATKAQAARLQSQMQEAGPPQTSPPATPQPLNDTLSGKKGGKGIERGTGAPKPKRRKSKAPTSPPSPLSTAPSPA